MPKVTLQAARINMGLSQEKMADKLGISRSLYQDIENGDKPMKPIYLFAICHVTGFNEDDFLLPDKYAKSEHTEET